MLEELKQELKEIQEGIDNADNAEEKKMFEGIKKQIEAKIKDEEKSPPKPAKKEKKAAPSKKAPAKPGKKTVTYKGKQYIEGSDEYCKALEKDYAARKKQSAQTKRKTKPVMDSVVTSLEAGIKRAIKISSARIKTPTQKKEMVSKYKKLNTSYGVFLKNLKSVLGKEYKSEEVTKSVQEVNMIIQKINKSGKK